jgi:hypothetical protein
MYASLRLISAAARRCLPNRLSVRGRLILLFFPTMRGVRSTLYGLLAKSNTFTPSGYTSGVSCVRFIKITTSPRFRFIGRRSTLLISHFLCRAAKCGLLAQSDIGRPIPSVILTRYDAAS